MTKRGTQGSDKEKWTKMVLHLNAKTHTPMCRGEKGKWFGQAVEKANDNKMTNHSILKTLFFQTSTVHSLLKQIHRNTL